MQNQKSDKKKEIKKTLESCVTFDEFKKSLGPEADLYSEEELEKIRNLCDTMADFLFTKWLKERYSGTVVPKQTQP